MTIRKILGGLGKTLIWGFISLALIYGLLLAINAVDESPAPEAEALLVIPQIKHGPDNGYLAMIGIDAPANQDIANYGAAWVDANNAATDKAAIEKTYALFPHTATLKLRGNEKLLCNPSKMPCLPQARAHADEWRKLAADNEMMLARQQQLLKFSTFEESYFNPSVDAAIPNYANRSRKLALNMIALDAAEGRLVPALAALESHIAFDRLALRGAHSLIMGMIATSWLKQDYALLAEIVASRPKALVAQQARLVRMTGPLEIEQIRAIAGRLLEGESRYMLNSLSQNVPDFTMGGTLDQRPDDSLMNRMQQVIVSALQVLQKPFYKPQATQNLSAHYMTALLARVRDFSPENAEARMDQAKQDEKNKADAIIYSWRVLYNPTGKFVMSTVHGEGMWDSYILRLSDLMGVTRLARLQVEVVTAGKAADIPARLAADRALYDPYTGKPMGWDAGKRQLYFDARIDMPPGTSKHIHAGI